MKSTKSSIAWSECAPEGEGAPLIDDTVNKPWRDEMLGYVNIELTADDGKRRVVAKEEVIWAAFNGRPPEGHRIGFLDGNPANCSIDNLVLLSPGEAEQLDEANVWRLPASARCEGERGQPLVPSYLDNVHVDQVFIAGGPAVLCKAMLQCAPNNPEWQCAPKARIISGGGFHPDNCR